MPGNFFRPITCESSIYGTVPGCNPVAGAISTGTKTTIAGTEIHDILRGIVVVIAGALMILPAYINYELYHRFYFELTVSMALSLVSFALGILIFILVVGKERIEGTKKP
ncbi:MAG TPA: hypothetical protein VGS11_05825 [Candidatus Bathyarchaeia archaeon]|nr:hypothetical protein [Candidatus Bathyarchaeia archaeon]